MSNLFFEKSKEIADNFIQSIVFLDDRAFNINGSNQSTKHDLSAETISQLFAKEKKICAFYDPNTTDDIEDFKYIAQKADIIVLDWCIDLTENNIPDDDNEEDADDDDIRGKYTKLVIQNIIDNQNQEGIKLILVYTGETDLNRIVDEISELNAQLEINKDNCELNIENTKILVRGKSNHEGEDTKYKYIENLKGKALDYTSLPNFLLDEFTAMTSGLLTNFALISLSKIRANSSKILGLFNKRLDAAFLAHKIVLPSPNDAESLLIDLLGSTISDLLNYELVDSEVQNNLIESWIEENNDINIDNVDPTKAKKVILNLLRSPQQNIEERFLEILKEDELSKNTIRKLAKNAIQMFLLKENSNEEELNIEFAKLTHHKSLFLPYQISPRLSLGTIVKSSRDQTYYICIQQKCDSIRIKEKARRFLFLSLAEVETKIQFITPDRKKLGIDNRSYSIRTVKFEGGADGVVKAVQDEGSYKFKHIYEDSDESFEWVLDLKDLHAQRIVNNYASTLSRVGIDESEWLRTS